jgi:hypothetical protein
MFADPAHGSERRLAARADGRRESQKARRALPMDVYHLIHTWEEQLPLRKLINRVEDRWLIDARWLVVLGAVLIQLALGAISAWGVFTGDLTDPAGLFGFSATQTQWIFSLGLAIFAVVTIFAGWLEARIGPRPVAILGGDRAGLRGADRGRDALVSGPARADHRVGGGRVRIRGAALGATGR